MEKTFAAILLAWGPEKISPLIQMSEAEKPTKKRTKRVLTIKNSKGYFKIRTAGIMRKENKTLLLNEPLVNNSWFLPGGKVEMHESTQEALSRELTEEICGMPLIGDLLWITENFFTNSQIPCHTLEFYYAFTLAAPHPLLNHDTYHSERSEDGITKQFDFRWFTPEEISSVYVLPPVLKKIILDPSRNSSSVRHLIIREEKIL
jgi:ADP-ribose pyrophosphatase YjhB (NUDIX family)